MRKKIWLTLLGIVVLAVLAGFISFPKGPDIQFRDYYKQIKVHLGLDLQGGTSLLYQADTSDIESGNREEALEGVRDVIERRVNAFGVSEPIVQTNKVGDDWRVIVELPGVTDINEAIDMIGETPLLEFKKEAGPVDLSGEEIQEIEARNQATRSKALGVLGEALAIPGNFAELATTYSEDTFSAEQGGSLGELIKGVTVPEFEQAIFTGEVGQVYPDLVETDYGYHIIKIESRDDEKETVTASHILFLTESTVTTQFTVEYENTELTGKYLNQASVSFDPNTGLPEIVLDFDSEGKDLFGTLTEENVGKTIAIYLDGSPISTPVVNEPIKDGSAVISGDFSLDEAKQLVRRLNAGALPVPISLISQQNIGPTLGSISIERSLLAGVIGLVLVALFMISYYRLPGFMAVVALVIYTLVVLAIFKLLPVVLTLAGIAGFILSIGMAVDANVLIFERMKEELRRGKSVYDSVEDGFKRAWPSIRDSNISTLITCSILTWFGSSLIKGFAITLGIGVLVSMFSAITISRTFLRLSTNQKMNKHLNWFGIKKKKEQENV